MVAYSIRTDFKQLRMFIVALSIDAGVDMMCNVTAPCWLSLEIYTVLYSYVDKRCCQANSIGQLLIAR